MVNVATSSLNYTAHTRTPIRPIHSSISLCVCVWSSFAVEYSAANCYIISIVKQNTCNIKKMSASYPKIWVQHVFSDNIDTISLCASNIHTIYIESVIHSYTSGALYIHMHVPPPQRHHFTCTFIHSYYCDCIRYMWWAISQQPAGSSRLRHATIHMVAHPVWLGMAFWKINKMKLVIPHNRYNCVIYFRWCSLCSHVADVVCVCV